MAYLHRFFLTLFGVLGIVALANAAIDPFSLFATPRINGFNQIKALTPGLERFYKPLQVSVWQPQTVLVGTSRVLVGLDPRDVPGGHVYNLGIAGAAAPELVALTQHVLADTPATRIVIGLDYESFVSPVAPPAFRLAILGRFAWWRALPDLLLSQHTLLMSRRALSASRRDTPPLYRDDGFRVRAYAEPGDTDIARQARSAIARFTEIYRHSPSTDQALAEFDTLLASLPTGRVSVTAFITPGPAALLENVMLLGRGADYENWLRQLTAMCAAHGVALWDFDGYNRITAVPLATSAAFFADATHFNPAVGRMIIDTMLDNAAQSDFGVRLTPDTITGYLEQQRTARAAWREREPDDVRLVEEATEGATGVNR
jgi:hypothetical protein